ncbi:hypothetical protein [Pseudoroseomonas cervicalis]|uniref:hypothetical protein n=1 Tax=Teichococcus cervicalis TaxID=204525 RepID=UPI0022F193EF|nr:hypothetical protein [Pseudoroseomonas cervicalis]WBV43154.1 hypothetical protein PFY06_00880 [Pseudoroseomonas cervicalis]
MSDCQRRTQDAEQQPAPRDRLGAEGADCPDREQAADRPADGPAPSGAALPDATLDQIAGGKSGAFQ